MRRKSIILLAAIWLTVGLALTPTGRAWAASDSATLKSVALSTSPTGTELDLHVDGAYTYKAVQASPDALFIDLTGAKAEGMAHSREWSNPCLTGYKLLSYQGASGQSVVRVQVGTKQAGAFVIQKDAGTLRLVFGQAQNMAAAAPVSAPAPTEPPLTTRALTAPASISSGPLTVSRVTLDKQASGETYVDVAMSRNSTYKVTTLPSPARLVVDIDGAENISPRATYPADTAVLKSVRIGQFRAKDPSVVRVVADLNGDPAFDVHSTPSGLRIELRPRGVEKSVPPPTAVPVPMVKPAELKTAQTLAPAPAPAPVAVAKTAPPVTEVITPKPAAAPPITKAEGETAKLDVQSTLPASTPTKQTVAAPLAAPPSPLGSTPEALRAEHAAKVLNIEGGEPVMAAQGAPPATPGMPEEAKPVQYTGEPISLNLKDVDLKDFFRLIHEISGLNIIIDPNVTGNVTMVLDSVPWDQALDIVLKNNGLGKVLEGNVLRIARIQTLTAEQDAQTKLAASRMDAAPLVTVFRPINYAKAQEIATVLKTWVGGGALTRRGTVLVDVRNNTLIISDVQTQIPVLMNIVGKMDKKAKQISIEARVVLATADFTRTLASSLIGGFQNNSTVTTGSTGAGSAISIPAPSAGASIPITTVTNAAGSGFGVAAVTNVGAHYFINAAISAAEERDQAKTLSRPTIVTQNNVQGTVQQGVQVPVQTTINNTISVQYENATLVMTVTPQVTDDNHIFLIINVNNASLGATVSQAGPSINTQQATTQVLVPDGGTVVFGGITVTSRSKSATYIPWLGSIPIIGNLFKTSNTSDQDQELLFFVSPKILPG